MKHIYPNSVATVFLCITLLCVPGQSHGDTEDAATTIDQARHPSSGRVPDATRLRQSFQPSGTGTAEVQQAMPSLNRLSLQEDSESASHSRDIEFEAEGSIVPIQMAGQSLATVLPPVQSSNDLMNQQGILQEAADQQVGLQPTIDIQPVNPDSGQARNQQVIGAILKQLGNPPVLDLSQ